MALSANSVWEVRTGGSDNNGGAFVTGASGTDRSQQDAAHATLSAASVVNAVTTQIDVALGDYTVIAGDVGNMLNVTGGTATAGVYEITAADTVNNRWTVDRSVGTVGQTVVGAMGGAFASIGRAGQFSVANNKVWIKSGTYTVTSATVNIAGGCFSKANVHHVEGYDATRGDLGTRPLIQTNGVIVTFTFIILTGVTSRATNIEADCNSRSTSRGINCAGIIYKCKVANATNNGIAAATNSVIIDCECTGCSTQPAFSVGVGAYGCIARDCTVTGFLMGGEAYLSRCIADSCTGASSLGFITSGTQATMENCVAYNCGADGFNLVNPGCALINCVAEDCGDWGYDFSAAATGCIMLNCAGFSNASGEVRINASAIFTENYGFITGSGSFFTNAAGSNFALNNNAGAGASLRATGFPSTFPGGFTANFLDIGAAQSEGSGGGGATSTVLRRQAVIPYRTHFRS